MLQAARLARNQKVSDAEMSLLTEKVPELDKRLKNLYVKSEGDNPELKPKRKLPEERGMVSILMILILL